MSTKKTGVGREVTPFHVFLANAISLAEVSNVEVAERLGYERPNVVSMLKNGTMKLPLNKIPEMAAVLRMDPVGLLQRALAAYAPELLDVLRTVMADRLVSQNELAILGVIRSRMKGIDFDPTVSDDFVMRLELLVTQVMEKHLKNELRADPNARPARDSKVAKLNAAMSELLTRQAKEREQLVDRIGKLLEDSPG